MMRIFFFFLTYFCVSIHYTIDATPSQVLIIREAENVPKKDSLSLKGKERAAAFSPFFMETKELLTSGPIVAIYVMGTSKTHSSKLFVDTVTPLSDSLKLKVKDQFIREDYKNMVAEIMKTSDYDGKTVLICWDYELIPEIARNFKALLSPNRWPKESFDRIWMISISLTGKATFQNIPQKLLFGDLSY